jgi:hypothetical protein
MEIEYMYLLKCNKLFMEYISYCYIYSIIAVSRLAGYNSYARYARDLLRSENNNRLYKSNLVTSLDFD